MRNALRRKPLHRLLLSAAIASLIAAPAAFATTHNNSHNAHHATTRAASHASSRHHVAYAENSHAKRSKHGVNRNSQSVADASQQRRHVHIPDEEELAQPEL